MRTLTGSGHSTADHFDELFLERVVARSQRKASSELHLAGHLISSKLRPSERCSFYRATVCC